MIMGVFSGITFFIKLSIRIFLGKFHHHTSRRSDDLSSQKNVLQAEYHALTNSPLSNMLAYHRELHSTILDEFSRITNAELDLPSTFWEETRFPIQHRLHRYEAHFVQHTIQIDKTLIAIGQAPSEAKRLVRKIYLALAEAEGQMLGTEKIDDTAILATASSIQERAKEIEKILK